MWTWHKLYITVRLIVPVKPKKDETSDESDEKHPQRKLCQKRERYVSRNNSILLIVSAKISHFWDNGKFELF